MGHLIIFVATALRMWTNQGQAVCRWAMRAATQFLERLRTLGVKVRRSFNLFQLQHQKWNISGDVQNCGGNHFNLWKNKWQTVGFSSNVFKITKIQYLYVHWIIQCIEVCKMQNAKCEMQSVIANIGSGRSPGGSSGGEAALIGGRQNILILIASAITLSH